jgi:hypothetical protein
MAGVDDSRKVRGSGNDGAYNRERPWVPEIEPRPLGPRWSYLGPFASNQERLCQQAIAANTLPGSELLGIVRTPLPQVDLFPPRFGYDPYVPGILDIIDVDRNYTEPRTAWFSGGPAGYEGSSRNALG